MELLRKKIINCWTFWLICFNDDQILLMIILNIWNFAWKTLKEEKKRERDKQTKITIFYCNLRVFIIKNNTFLCIYSISHITIIFLGSFFSKKLRLTKSGGALIGAIEGCMSIEPTTINPLQTKQANKEKKLANQNRKSDKRSHFPL